MGIAQRLIGKVPGLRLPEPSIALVGPEGVGKSKLINELFGTRLRVSDTLRGTTEPIQRRPKTVNGQRLTVWDMPGVGGFAADESDTIAYYREILPRVDTVLWAVDSPRGGAGLFEHWLTSMLPEIDARFDKKIFFVLTRADLLGADDWMREANVPNERLYRKLEARRREVERQVERMVPSWTGTIPFCSATMRYRLEFVQREMLRHTPSARAALALSDRLTDLSFERTVSPELLAVATDT